MFELHVACRTAALDIWVETETPAIRPRAGGALQFGNPQTTVMAGLVPAIHVFLA
jgi:hypothetical protein